MNRPTSQRLEVAKPVQSPYGLLSPAVKVIEIDNDWWLSGAIHELYDGGVSYSVVADQGFDPDDVIREMVVEDLGEPRFVHIVPVTVEARIRTSTIGVDLDDLKQKAEDAIELVQQKAIETAFLEYLGSGFRSLAGENETVNSVQVSSPPVPPRYAQALLEGAVADNTVGYQATLHFPRLASSNLRVWDVDGVLTTRNGSQIIAGSGYSIKGPDGSDLPETQRAAYATGPVTVVLGETVLLPDDVSQVVDTKNNTAELFAQRPAMVAFSTKDVFSVLVDTTLDS